MEIGERIRTRRLQLGYSQDYLAKLVGYKSRVAICMIESGQRDFPRNKVEAFARALNTTTDYIMGFENSTALQKMINQNQPPTPVDDLCTKIQDSNLQDDEVDYIDKQVDFIVAQRK